MRLLRERCYSWLGIALSAFIILNVEIGFDYVGSMCKHMHILFLSNPLQTVLFLDATLVRTGTCAYLHLKSGNGVVPVHELGS